MVWFGRPQACQTTPRGLPARPRAGWLSARLPRLRRPVRRSCSAAPVRVGLPRQPSRGSPAQLILLADPRSAGAVRPIRPGHSTRPPDPATRPGHSQLGHAARPPGHPPARPFARPPRLGHSARPPDPTTSTPASQLSHRPRPPDSTTQLGDPDSAPRSCEPAQPSAPATPNWPPNPATQLGIPPCRPVQAASPGPSQPRCIRWQCGDAGWRARASTGQSRHDASTSTKQNA